MNARRISYLFGVAGISLLTAFTAETYAARYPNSGFARFMSIAHSGGNA